jgi:hypothetical protein
LKFKVSEKIGTLKSKATKKKTETEQELSIQEMVQKALAECRTAVCYDDFDFKILTKFKSLIKGN